MLIGGMVPTQWHSALVGMRVMVIEPHAATREILGQVLTAHGMVPELYPSVADAPAGEVRYWLRIGDGTASVSLGDAQNAEVTIRQSYETSAQVNRGELDGAKAFTQGKVTQVVVNIQ